MALEKTFKKYGIIIDTQCKDIPRFRFLTSDRDAVINPKAVPYRITYQEQKKTYCQKKEFA